MEQGVARGRARLAVAPHDWQGAGLPGCSPEPARTGPRSLAPGQRSGCRTSGLHRTAWRRLGATLVGKAVADGLGACIRCVAGRTARDRRTAAGGARACSLDHRVEPAHLLQVDLCASRSAHQATAFQHRASGRLATQVDARHQGAVACPHLPGGRGGIGHVPAFSTFPQCSTPGA